MEWIRVTQLWVDLAALPSLVRFTMIVGVVYLVSRGVSAVLGRNRIQVARPTHSQILREIGWSFCTVLVFSGFLWIAINLGIARLTKPGAYGPFGIVVLVVGLIVCHDAYFYWTHRLLHSKPLATVHWVHHRSRTPTVWAAYSLHPVEAMLNAPYLVIAAAIIPLDPIALVTFVTIMISVSAIGHCGRELYPRRPDGSPRFAWLNTVTNHDLHHERSRGNFGFYFTFWDRLMRTEDPLSRERFAMSSQRGGRYPTASTPRARNAEASAQVASSLDRPARMDHLPTI